MATASKPLVSVHFQRLPDDRLELVNPEWPKRLRIAAPLVFTEKHIKLKDGPKGQVIDIECANARAVYLIYAQRDGYIRGSLVYEEPPK